jgi:DNA-binding transcriptional ArsR family regulator
MTDFDPNRAVSVLRVLANPHRLAILQRLLASECVVAELESELGIRQPGLSQHLGELRDVGLVTSRREARSVYYRIVDRTAHQLVKAVVTAFGRAPIPPRSAQASGSSEINQEPKCPAGVAHFARVLS